MARVTQDTTEDDEIEAEGDAGEPEDDDPEDAESEPDDAQDEGSDEEQPGADLLAEPVKPRRKASQKAPAKSRPGGSWGPKPANDPNVKQPDSPAGWKLLYEVSYAHGDRTPEFPIRDCFDIEAAQHEIGEHHGAVKVHWRTIPPLGSGIPPTYRPWVRDADGSMKQVDRRGSWTVNPQYILREFGYWHMPLSDKDNLIHRDAAPPNVKAQALAQGEPPMTMPGTKQDNSAPASAAPQISASALMQIGEIKQQIAALRDQPEKEDFAVTMERMRLAEELRRQQRKIEREEEEEAERKARAKKRSEREEEEEARRERWAEEDRRRRAESEIDRERRREEFEHQLRMSREEYAARREETRLEMEREKGRGGEGGALGSLLLDAILGRVQQAVGSGGLIDKLLGRGGDDEDEGGSVLSSVSKGIGLFERLTGAIKSLPQPVVVAPQPVQQQLPAPQPAPAPAPAMTAAQAVRAAAAPPAAAPAAPGMLADSEDFPAITENGTTIVKTPQGYGVRTPQGLVAVKPEFAAQLDEAFAKYEAEQGGEEEGEEPDDEDEDFEDEMQQIAFNRLRDKAPALEPLVLEMLSMLKPMGKVSKFDVDLLVAACSGVLDEYEAEDRTAAVASIAELDPGEFAENLPYFADPKERPALKTDAARAALREALERLKAVTKPG